MRPFQVFSISILVCGLALGVLLPGSGRAATVPPARDFRLVLFAIGDWRGDFETDAAGRGGMAALHTLVERTRGRLNVARGQVLLTHAGDLTGATSARDFVRRLLPPGLNLLRYLKMDAVAFSPRENDYLATINFLPDVRFARAVEYNRGQAPMFAAPVDQFRIAPGEDYNTFLSGWTDPALAEQTTALKTMRAEFERQSGLDLTVLLVSGEALNPEDPLVAEQLLGQSPDQNPYDLLDPSARPVLVVRSSAPRNRFRQLGSGAYLCAVKGRDVCRVEFLFREHRLIGVTQHFIDLNGTDHAGAWIPPDPRLVRLLRKQREAGPAPLHDPRGEKPRPADPDAMPAPAVPPSAPVPAMPGPAT